MAPGPRRRTRRKATAGFKPQPRPDLSASPEPAQPSTQKTRRPGARSSAQGIVAPGPARPGSGSGCHAAGIEAQREASRMLACPAACPCPRIATYPILMRLADRGLLETSWDSDTPAGRPPRHLYRLAGEGRTLATDLAAAPARQPDLQTTIPRLSPRPRSTGSSPCSWPSQRPSG